VVASAEYIIHVHVRGERVEGVEESHAFLAWFCELEILQITVGINLVVEAVINEAIPVTHLEHSWHRIVLPICDSISHQEAFKVWYVISSALLSNDVLVKLINKLGHIYSGVRLTRDVGRVIHDFWEFLENGQDGISVPNSCVVIIKFASINWVIAD
jgi:hypothetical protein